jgi:hypothetical protein
LVPPPLVPLADPPPHPRFFDAQEENVSSDETGVVQRLTADGMVAVAWAYSNQGAYACGGGDPLECSYALAIVSSLPPLPRASS